MKSTKRIVSIIIAIMMLMSCVTVSVNASTGTLCSDYYATNPNGKVGIQKTITIDGDASDWSEDMLIAQGAAWDVANHYKGGHENCVLDTYALFATWDSSNLYVGWQMVNTTDTWARSGDGPLSDGGRVLDVPLILALSVDPQSTSMSNKNSNGGPIWGQKMGLSFDTHVDRLFYMSGKPGLGEPAMFTAVDANGNTDYTTGCHTFKSSGIEYKMAETNICSNIYGLNYSENPKDVYDSDADWVDYKAFKGSAGTHSTKYDSFYEMKIPFSTLGIDKNYLETYGIGAMLVATRGESGLDCIPFDDTMLDNALDSYSNDPSTSKEKDDEDVITSDFARIGNLGGITPPQPTTAPATDPTTAPTTQPVTQPATDLTVTATSNLFPAKTVTFSQEAKTVTVSYDLKSAMELVNGQVVLSYDSSVLKFDPAKNSDIMPYISDETKSLGKNTVKSVFSNINNLYDFTTLKNFVNVTFDVLGTGSTTVDLRVDELSVGYFSGDVLNYKSAVSNGVKVDLSKVPGFTGSSISGTTSISANQPTTEPATDLKVNATSNLFGNVAKTYDKSTNELTISYDFSSDFDVVDTQWILSYDATKLSYNPSKNGRAVMSNFSNAIVNAPRAGQVKGVMSSLELTDFRTEKSFVKVVFDVIGAGTADVNLNVEYLGLGFYSSTGDLKQAYLIDHSRVQNVSGISGFSTEKYTAKTVFDPTDRPLAGDVNMDGVVNIIDATLVQKHATELIVLTDAQLKIADVDNNGVVDVRDATRIQKLAIEL